MQKVSYNKYNIYGVVQGGCLAFDQPEITISFYDPVESVSRVYFIKFIPSLTKPEGNTSYSNVLTSSVGSLDSLVVGDDNKVVDLVHLMPHPITFSQSLNITVAYEYAPGKLIFGMDEPGYLLADKNSGD